MVPSTTNVVRTIEAVAGVRYTERSRQGSEPFSPDGTFYERRGERGKDHVRQIVFIALSLAGLLLPARQFFPRRGARACDSQSTKQPRVMFRVAPGDGAPQPRSERVCTSLR